MAQAKPAELITRMPYKTAADPGIVRFVRGLKAILAAAERHELPPACNMVEQAIARRAAL